MDKTPIYFGIGFLSGIYFMNRFFPFKYKKRPTFENIQNYEVNIQYEQLKNNQFTNQNSGTDNNNFDNKLIPNNRNTSYNNINNDFDNKLNYNQEIKQNVQKPYSKFYDNDPFKK